MAEQISQKCRNILVDEISSKVKSVKKDEKSRISPAKMSIDLRYKDPFKFKINFTSPQFYPIDMYYLVRKRFTYLHTYILHTDGPVAVNVGRFRKFEKIGVGIDE